MAGADLGRTSDSEDGASPVWEREVDDWFWSRLACVGLNIGIVSTDLGSPIDAVFVSLLGGLLGLAKVALV